MNSDKIKELQIPQAAKKRPQGSLFAIFVIVILVSGVAIYFAWPRAKEDSRIMNGDTKVSANGIATKASSVNPTTAGTNAASGSSPDAILTVSGYIINRQRIELS